MHKKSTKLEYLKSTLESLSDDLSKDWREYQCIEWPFAINHNGYGFLHRTNQPGNRGVFVHRFACEHAWGPLGDGKFALHHCDNRSCFRPIHMFPGTLADNIHDCIAKGRFRGKEPRPLVRGVLNGNVKLTDDIVRTLRNDRKEWGLSYEELGRRHSISSVHARDIVLNLSWKHIK